MSRGSYQNDASVSPKVGELVADMIGTLVAFYKMKKVIIGTRMFLNAIRYLFGLA